MKSKTKPELKQALAQILEKAKTHRDFANTPFDKERWVEIVKLAYAALEEPSMADIAAYLNLREPASKKTHNKKKEKKT
jgi:hypothetical protein